MSPNEASSHCKKQIIKQSLGLGKSGLCAKKRNCAKILNFYTATLKKAIPQMKCPPEFRHYIIKTSEYLYNKYTHITVSDRIKSLYKKFITEKQSHSF